MKNNIKKYLLIINKHGTLITLAAGVIPLLVSLVMAVYFSRGDLVLANYIIQEVGIFQIWSSALVLVAFTVLQIILALVMFNRRYQEPIEKYLGTAGVVLIGAVTFTIVPMLVLLGPVLGALAAIITKKFLPKLSQKVAKNIDSVTRSTYIIFGCLILYTGIISYPLMPPSQLTYKDGSKESVVILSHKDGGYLLLEVKTHSVKRVNDSKVTDEKLCRDVPQKWYTGTLISAINHLTTQKDIVPSC